MAFTYSKLAEVTLASSASSIDFTNIPQNYNDLKIVASVRNNGAQYYGRVYFNANTTGYSRKGLYGDGTSAGSLSIANEYTFVSNPSTYTANTFSNFEMYVPNYNGSTNKSFSIDATTENNATISYLWMYAGLWSNTTSITRITLEPNPGDLFVQYSTATLYGVKAEV